MADKDFRVKLGIEVGANAAIQGAITTVDSIQLDLAAGVDVPELGQLAWNVDDNTVSLGLGAVSLQLGQEEYIYIKNQSGETIGNGNTVMFAGTIGNSGRILGAKGVADGSFPSKYIIGIASHDIADGEDGYVTTFGKVRQIDTSMFSEGDILFANPASPGTLSNTIPIAPNNKVTVAAVVNSDAINGELFVRVTFADKVGELEDVYLNNINDGEMLIWRAANSRFESGNVSSEGGTTSNSFATIAVAGQSNVVANTSTDVLTLVAGPNVTVSTNAAINSITIDSATIPVVRSVTAGATSGTLTIDSAITDIFVAEGLTGGITFAQPSGTPSNGQKLLIRIKDNGTARSITWTTSAGAFRAIGVTLPTTTVIDKTSYVGCIYNSADSFWDTVAVTTQT